MELLVLFSFYYVILQIIPLNLLRLSLVHFCLSSNFSISFHIWNLVVVLLVAYSLNKLLHYWQDYSILWFSLIYLHLWIVTVYIIYSILWWVASSSGKHQSSMCFDFSLGYSSFINVFVLLSCFRIRLLTTVSIFLLSGLLSDTLIAGWLILDSARCYSPQDRLTLVLSFV